MLARLEGVGCVRGVTGARAGHLIELGSCLALKEFGTLFRGEGSYCACMCACVHTQ